MRFRDPARMRSGDLAFESDRRALQAWGKMKERHTELKKAFAARWLSELREFVGPATPGPTPQGLSVQVVQTRVLSGRLSWAADPGGWGRVKYG